ncbi:MAG: LysR family transcriptional regulator [Gammaproteobacteria bacterium]|nr:LysR family transcriptional regulator [Gammaproteobacteria bacterium]
MDWLRATKYFVDVAKTQSFSEVARKRHTSPSVITKHIDWLEDKLNATLLERSTRMVNITEAGRHFLDYANTLLESTTTITQELQNFQVEPTGSLSITTSKLLGEHLFTDLILAFQKQYPKIQIFFDATNRMVDLQTESYDIALRVGEISDKRFSSQFWGKISYGIYAAPNYLKNNTKITTPEQLIEHHCINHFDAVQQTNWKLKDGKHYAINAVIVSNSFDLQIKAALAGVGLIMLPHFLVAQYLKEKKLAQVLKSYSPEPTPIYIVTRKEQKNSRVKMFIDFLNKKPLITQIE